MDGRDKVAVMGKGNEWSKIDEGEVIFSQKVRFSILVNICLWGMSHNIRASVYKRYVKYGKTDIGWKNSCKKPEINYRGQSRLSLIIS